MSDKKKILIFVLIILLLSIASYYFTKVVEKKDSDSKNIVDRFNSLLVSDVSPEDIKIIANKIVKVKSRKTLLGLRRLNIVIDSGFKYKEDINKDIFYIVLNPSDNKEHIQTSINLRSEIDIVQIKSNVHTSISFNNKENILYIFKKEKL